MSAGHPACVEILVVVDEQHSQPLAALPIRLVEAPEERAVEVEHANDFAAFDQWHDEFRARVRIAGDMPRKIVHIRHQHRLASRCGGPTHALADCNPLAGGAALERAEHQLVALAEIKPGPVQIGQAVIHQRCHIGGVCDPIGFAGKQRHQLPDEIAVEFGFAGIHPDFPSC